MADLEPASRLIESAGHRARTRVALEGRRDAVAASLPHGDQRKLEVAMLLALRGPKVFMFDEPTAA